MKLVITQPDDWHVHLRDDAALENTVPTSAQTFARAVVMPNLSVPICTVEEAHAYRERILAILDTGSQFKPLMTLYLTENTSAATIHEAKASGFIHGVKWYPKAATTNSEFGISNSALLENVFTALQETQLPLLIHGESCDPEIDIFDREAHFITHTLKPLLQRFPHLRVVLEHITSEHAVDFIRHTHENVAATITAHHLLLTRNDLLVGGIKPHYYCLPILKAKKDQLALIAAATSGHPRFFLGTDSAPHVREKKETACGCAGIYTAPLALPLYAEVFDKENTLNRLEDFASHFGARFYRLPINKTQIILKKQPWQVPDSYPLGHDQVVIPLFAGQTLNWQVFKNGQK